MATGGDSRSPPFDRQHPAAIYSDFTATDLARHLALFYESIDEQLAVVGAFVKHQLRNDRRCLYLADANPIDAIRLALEAVDIDVDARIAAGDLQLRDAETVYLEQEFDPERMKRTLETACVESLEDGYAGLSVAGENTWCFHADEAFDPILEFEADFDACCPDLSVTALCQYDLTRFSEASIAKVLRTHRQIVYRARLCENPYYVPPEAYARSTEPHHNARLMLEQTHGLAEANRAVERHEQRLSVLNRVLRHNVRNELNVVLGNLDALDGAADLGAEQRGWLETAREHARNVVDLSEKARYVEETIAASSAEPTRLSESIDRAIERVETEYRNRGPRCSVLGNATKPVIAADNFDAAVLELARNAIEHQDGDPPTVTFELSEPNAEVVRLDVTNPGEPIPSVDQRAILEGRETPLQHSRGLGLWLVKWLVENSHGTVSFTDTEDGECLVRIELPTAE
jgi:signal transduction histidine kinase